MSTDISAVVNVAVVLRHGLRPAPRRHEAKDEAVIVRRVCGADVEPVLALVLGLEPARRRRAQRVER